MKKIYAKHEPYENGHLGDVVSEMKLTGPPTIRVIEFDGGFYAVEGSHRLASAYHLGLEPKIVIMPQDSEGLDEYWARVARTLPSYDYKFVYILDLGKLEKEADALGLLES